CLQLRRRAGGRGHAVDAHRMAERARDVDRLDLSRRLLVELASVGNSLTPFTIYDCAKRRIVVGGFGRVEARATLGEKDGDCSPHYSSNIPRHMVPPKLNCGLLTQDS